MSTAHVNARRQALTAGIEHEVERVAPGWLVRGDALRLYLHDDADAPGWSATTPEQSARGAVRPVSVTEAVTLAGPDVAADVLRDTRAILDALPVPTAARLRDELVIAERLVLAEACDELTAIRSRLDVLVRLLPVAPDVLAELNRTAEHVAAHLAGWHRQLDTADADALLAAIEGGAR